jgi:hypothetical protein
MPTSLLAQYLRQMETSITKHSTHTFASLVVVNEYSNVSPKCQPVQDQPQAPKRNETPLQLAGRSNNNSNRTRKINKERPHASKEKQSHNSCARLQHSSQAVLAQLTMAKMLIPPMVSPTFLDHVHSVHSHQLATFSLHAVMFRSWNAVRHCNSFHFSIIVGFHNFVLQTL